MLNDKPSSALNNWKLPITWMSKNEQRNNPVNATDNFWPIEELNSFDNQFIILFG
jgi:hypothetical protein